MPLTELEKRAGKVFRALAQGKLTSSFADGAEFAPCDPHIREYRHDCAARGGVSWPLRLKEHTEDSPEYWVCYCSVVAPHGDTFPHDDCQGGKPVARAGLFSFTWTDGHCKCGLTVRSSSGRFQVNG